MKKIEQEKLQLKTHLKTHLEILESDLKSDEFKFVEAINIIYPLIETGKNLIDFPIEITDELIRLLSILYELENKPTDIVLITKAKLLIASILKKIDDWNN